MRVTGRSTCSYGLVMAHRTSNHRPFGTIRTARREHEKRRQIQVDRRAQAADSSEFDGLAAGRPWQQSVDIHSSDQIQQQHPLENHSNGSSSDSSNGPNGSSPETTASLVNSSQQQQNEPRDNQSIASTSSSDVQKPTLKNKSSMPVVPWGLNTTVTVLIVWLVGFWAAAYIAVPSIMELLDLNSVSSLARVQAFRHLVLDLMQLTITLTVLKQALREYNTKQLGLFAISWQPWKKWATAVFSGALLFPLVDWVHKNMVVILTHGVQSAQAPVVDNLVTNSDWVAKAMWAFVLTVCAPIWEEAMFRGFLIPSLAKYMPASLAIAGSSLIFASVHFTRDGFLPLLLLGLVFGSSYARTMNLLPPIILHSLWNLCLLTQILAIH